MTDDHGNPAAGGQGTDSGLAGEWGHVADALTSLAASIAQATKPAVDPDDTRRRLQELSEGLVALSARVAGEPVPAPRDLGETMEFPVVMAPQPESHMAGFASLAAPEPEPEDSREVLPEVLLATQKFRRAAEEAETLVVTEPAQQQLVIAAEAPVAGAPVPTPVAAAPVPAAPAQTLDLEGETSIRDWLFPVGDEEEVAETALSAEPTATEAAPASEAEAAEITSPAEDVGSDAVEPALAAPAPAAAAAPAPAAAPATAAEPAPAATPVATPSGLEAVRVAHERFLAERRVAEEAAAAALSKTHEAEGHVHRPPISPPSDDDAPLW